MFIAYNANAGLPFVPTYDLNAELPSGGKLVKGNEVRIGGFRVGVVKDMRPKVTTVNGERRSVAVAELKLDKKIEPLARDTEFRVRPRSALGLKYIELRARHQPRPPGSPATRCRSSSPPSRSSSRTCSRPSTARPGRNIQRATDGFGNAFAGRGRAINHSIEALNPFFKALTPVMRNLSNPRTELDQFFLQIGRASEQVAPVAPHAGAAVHGHGRHVRGDLRQPERAPGHDREGAADDGRLDRLVPRCSARSWPTSRTCRRDLRPAAAELPRSLGTINQRFEVGTPVLPRTVELNENLEKAFNEADDLFENPNTLLALKDLTTAVTVTRPALEYIAPYQTVCNYLNYFIHPLGEVQSVVQSGPTGGGTCSTRTSR